MATWHNWQTTGSVYISTATTSAVWEGWNTTTSANITGDTWYQWQGTDCSTTANDVTWQVWIDGEFAMGTTGTVTVADDARIYAEGRVVAVPPETEELRQEWAERRQREQEEIRLANERAEELLRESLTEEQQKELDELASFIVESAKRRYRVKRKGMVEELDQDDKVFCHWCIHTSYGYRVPDADTMLAQKLLIEVDEEEFRRIGNRHALLMAA